MVKPTLQARKAELVKRMQALSALQDDDLKADFRAVNCKQVMTDFLRKLFGSDFKAGSLCRAIVALDSSDFDDLSKYKKVAPHKEAIQAVRNKRRLPDWDVQSESVDQTLGQNLDSSGEGTGAAAAEGPPASPPTDNRASLSASAAAGPTGPPSSRPQADEQRSVSSPLSTDHKTLGPSPSTASPHGHGPSGTAATNQTRTPSVASVEEPASAGARSCSEGVMLSMEQLRALLTPAQPEQPPSLQLKAPKTVVSTADAGSASASEVMAQVQRESLAEEMDDYGVTLNRFLEVRLLQTVSSAEKHLNSLMSGFAVRCDRQDLVRAFNTDALSLIKLLKETSSAPPPTRAFTDLRRLWTKYAIQFASNELRTTSPAFFKAARDLLSQKGPEVFAAGWKRGIVDLLRPLAATSLPTSPPKAQGCSPPAASSQAAGGNAGSTRPPNSSQHGKGKGGRGKSPFN